MSSENGNGTATQPLTKGQAANGRFLPGHKLAKGNPFLHAVQNYRRLAYENVTDERFLELWTNLWDVALHSKSPFARIEATREILDRLLGKCDRMTPDQIQAIQINVGLAEPKPLGGVTVNGHTNGQHHSDD